jgi:hypothetical protein
MAVSSSRRISLMYRRTGLMTTPPPENTEDRPLTSTSGGRSRSQSGAGSADSTLNILWTGTCRPDLPVMYQKFEITAVNTRLMLVGSEES